ncbi:hypothetical protein [Saccharothrix deserti]|uniref:hypothetical protein n=1 Tax=Saccharothrix deserti TaxID=2593674 RepID=UPI00131C161C|nr:hypothetical protein [Saccharothrix deserti]
MKLRRSTVVLTTVALLALSACASGQDQPAPPADAVLPTGSTHASSSPTKAPEVLDNQPPAAPRTGPAQAEVGVAHPFGLLAHCGVVYAVFAGRTWKVEQPVVDPPGEPLARGSVNYLPGSMRLTAADRLEFTVDAGSAVIPSAVVTFLPTTEERPLCN